jgi:NAD(P)-dependent dehydrogenase (short-subunit alcohol dehydrogenase family)
MYSINGKVVLVSGSNTGLGKELARQLCIRGASVVLNGRDQEKLRKTLRYFKESGYNVTAVKGDISQPDDCRIMVDHCIEKFGRLDVLICNAGVSAGGAFAETTPETFRQVFEINTLGTIFLTRAALAHILESQGSIIFISSLAGLIGLPFSSLYSSSKMALTAVAQSLRAELTGNKVHVGIIYAGFLENAPEKRVIGPSGELKPVGERKTFSVEPMEKAGRAVIRMIERRRNKIVLSLMGRSLYFVLRFAPWLVWLILRMNIKKAREIYEPRSGK